MITDIRAISAQTELQADVCIIGAGAAGIAIARELLPSTAKVVLLESGGLRLEKNVQSLYEADCVGEPYYKKLDECRTRYFGGSTNCWGAIFTPLNEIDFEKRSWVPWSGWPVRYEEMRPWMRQAHDDYGAGPFLYDAAAWGAAGIPEPEFDPTRLNPMVWHFNSRADTLSFGKRFRPDLRKAPNIHVLLHANATELLTNESGKAVERVRVETLERKVNYIRAKVFILACGGIENARLLLASDRTQRKGLGNDRDMVGRFFHEHLQLACGVLVSSKNRRGAARYSHLARLQGTFCLPGLTLAPAAQIAHKCLNGAISVEPFHDRESVLLAFQSIRSSLKARKISPAMLNQIWRICCEGNKLAPEAWRRVVHGDRPQGDPGKYIIYARGEQAPNPDSRVILSNEADRLGMRRAVLDWRTTPLDRKSIQLMGRFATLEFKRLGLGHVIETSWPEGGEWPAGMAEGPHHMGTTRMSDDPASGVVDRNCRVHGLQGLYIAGSSVFPTGGHANPTLSIIAFAMRLATHVREVLTSGSHPIGAAASMVATRIAGKSTGA